MFIMFFARWPALLFLVASYAGVHQLLVVLSFHQHAVHCRMSRNHCKGKAILTQACGYAGLDQSGQLN